MARSKVRSWYGMIASPSLLVACACASAPPPTDKMASVEASIRAARDLGSGQVRSSQTSLKLAEDELSRARELSKNDSNDKAASMLERAAADAELAIALAQEDRIREKSQRDLEQSQ